MKRLCALTIAFLLSACSHTPVAKSPSELVLELQQLSARMSEGLKAPAMSEARLAPDAVAPDTKLIGISPTTTDAYLGWVKSSVGFRNGEMLEANLNSLGIDLPYSWRVLKRWPDRSVKIAQFKTVAFFNGLGVTPVSLQSGKNPKPYFAWHPAVWDAIITNRLQSQYKVQAVANGVSVECVPTAGAWKFLVADATELVIRFRSHCYNRTTFAPHALSITGFWTMMSDDPTIRTHVVLGNDQLETPVQGGIQLNAVTLSTGNLPNVLWVNEPSYGSKSALLSDGQTMAFKTVFTLDPAFASTAHMIATGEPMGFQAWPDMVASNAFGTAPLPPTRVPVSQIQAVHAQVSSEASFPNASANQWLGVINQNPPSTGSQSDFSGTMHVDLQKASQSYSSRKMASILLASYRESYRGSFLWDGAERFNALTDPSLFCWSGKCPHYDWSWNNDQREVWHARTIAGGFNPGDMSGWGTHDHQHVSMNAVRQGFELTGDVLLEEWLKYQITMFAVGYFSAPRWTNNVEAERAFGRSVKEAMAISELFPDLPETALLKPRIEAKYLAHRNSVTATVAQFGHVGSSLMDACDPRVNDSGNWAICPIQQALNQGNIVVGGWQTGFVQEAELLNPNADLRYIAAASDYFAQDGNPKTYFLVNNVNEFKQGGIGLEWWAPYITLSLRHPTAPGAQFLVDHLKPILDDRFQHGCGFPSPYFCLNDGWKSW